MTLDDRLKTAKARLSLAAARCLTDHDERAARAADYAHAEVQAALAMQRARAGHVCSKPGCNRITLKDRCDIHRPADIWGESRRLMDEIGRGER